MLFILVMVRTYVSKNMRGKWTVESMRDAVAAILDGGKLRTIAKQFSVPRNTLRRQVEAHKGGKEVVKQLGKKSILTASQENDLVNVTLSMESRLFGLSVMDLRRLVYQYCDINKIANPFNQERKMAGDDWARAFLKRHPNLTIRQPEAVSIGRAIGFNKEKTKRFYDVLQSVLFEDATLIIPDSNIYNVDETGLTVCQKPTKIIAAKGKRCVGSLTSAEKGRTITVICCVNGIGTFIPPMMIFPRVRMKPELIDKAPNGSIGVATKSGWVNEEAFLKWFNHFLHFVQPKTRDQPVILIMDGHSSHTKNLTLVETAKAQNVVLISLPSHSTHRLQPLDISFFKSLKCYYNQEIQSWLRKHPGRPVTEYQIAELFSGAYRRAASISNALSGFQESGIVPFNRNIFDDNDYVAADVTDQNVSATFVDAQKDHSYSCQDKADDHNDIREATHQSLPTGQTVSLPEGDSIAMDRDLLVQADQNHNAPCVNLEATSFYKLISMEQTPYSRSTKRREVWHAKNLTSTPYKEELQALKKKQTKAEQNNSPPAKRCKKSINFTMKGGDCAMRRRKVSETTRKRASSNKNSMMCESSFKRTNTRGKSKKNCEKELKPTATKVLCLYCMESFDEEWICCQLCKQWAHTACAGVDEDTDNFICEQCE